jgi:hypothetical protein
MMFLVCIAAMPLRRLGRSLYKTVVDLHALAHFHLYFFILAAAQLKIISKFITKKVTYVHP